MAPAVVALRLRPPVLSVLPRLLPRRPGGGRGTCPAGVVPIPLLADGLGGRRGNDGRRAQPRLLVLQVSRRLCPGPVGATEEVPDCGALLLLCVGGRGGIRRRGPVPPLLLPRGGNPLHVCLHRHLVLGLRGQLLLVNQVANVHRAVVVVEGGGLGAGPLLLLLLLFLLLLSPVEDGGKEKLSIIENEQEQTLFKDLRR